MTTISTRVRELLESLGSTPDEVAESLRQRGIKGTREDGCDCPIARVIQAEFPESRPENGAVWDDKDGAWFVSSILVSTPDGKLRDALPGAVQDFIEIFDDGIGDDPYYNTERPYADLEEVVTISERVAAGAAWLDENRPGWVSQIDLNVLSLHECCLCVIGQTFGCYASTANPFELDRNVAVEHGFNAPIKGDWWGENERLQAEWVRVITERREAEK